MPKCWYKYKMFVHIKTVIYYKNKYKYRYLG